MVPVNCIVSCFDFCFVRLQEENQRLRSDLLAAGVEVEEDQTKEALY